ncbi:MAG TPA: DEAD/DEAH box helicase [Bryobacteraceae bacterium]|jgi:ATP-dependent Lhr-like helicase|nr:DEAD/DEAH box helicase [Bryobacteraceae bacterium]
MPLSGFDPIVQRWFEQRFGSPTQPQVLGWREISAGHDTLISAPTGSGKTLAAFLICLDKLVRAAREQTLPDATQVVYVSPLKALSNDIHRNLEVPLAEIAELAKEMGIPLQSIRTALRTGDTPMTERAQMTRKPPHILITTPESLFIILTADKPRQVLRTTTTVIVDEIHAMADDKRGSHLALSLARLEALADRRPLRIGLSATVRPVEEVGRFLGPNTRIVDVGHRRDMELAIEVPRDELSCVASTEMWNEVYDRLAELILANRSTLVFVNTRRLSERVAHALGERLGPNAVLPHHGSLSRHMRLDAESRLKAGELRAVVATASLELGIDIGSVDLVCQIGSPRSIAIALQRIGRSGHWVGAKPHGRLFVTTRDELIECGAVISAIHKGDLEHIEIPQNALDILAQQIVAAAAAEPWNEDDLFHCFRSAYPYRNLPRDDFDSIVEMLSEGIATSRGRSGALLHRDRVNGRVRGRRGARLAAITSGGAIPENANYSVIAEPDAKVIGTLDEDFAVESLVGDVFLLGTHSWRIKRVEPGRVRVTDAHGAAPSIPFWLGEAPGRSRELSAEVSRLRERILADPDPTPAFLLNECGMDEAGAKQAALYVRAGTAELGALPTQTTVVAERFFDQGGGMQLVLHAPFGSRIMRAWGLALRKRFCRSFNFELQAAATDNGLVISLREQHSFPLDLVFAFLKSGTVEDVLRQALLTAPMFGARWRWNTTRALAILRFRGGTRIPAPIQRMRADDLLACVFPDQVACAENLTGPMRIPDHPLVKETIDNCMYEAMDLHGLQDVLRAIEAGRIRTRAIDTAQASQFSHEIINANPYAYLDDAPLEERRTRAVQIRQTLGTDVTGEGVLDPAVIDEISAEAWPEARDADELHDAMLTLIRVPPAPEWQAFFEELVASHRASVITCEDKPFWVATERMSVSGDPNAVVTGWMESLGPVTANALAERIAFPYDAVENALMQLEARGQVLRGHFRNKDAEIEWCNRRILARIHRATLGRLRREIEPVTSLDFERFLQVWQHVSPGTQLHGADGTLQVIRQLQGYELPASAWESEILARRIAKYDPDFLDELCLSGEVMWARVSPHPAIAENRRVRPTRIAPITLFLREDVGWLMTPEAKVDCGGLSHPAQDVLRALERKGASFFIDLARETHRLPSEVEDGLWELLAGGFVTADGFDNLRALIDPKRRRGEGRGSTKRPRHAAGRWALLAHQPVGLTPDERAERYARQLLDRWGVLLRDLLARETLAPPWRDLLGVLRRMEARGEIRGGRFVSGFTGEQFARPEALSLLRMIRREPDRHPTVAVANADPLNLAGIILPGPRVSRLAIVGLTPA